MLIGRSGDSVKNEEPLVKILNSVTQKFRLNKFFLKLYIKVILLILLPLFMGCAAREPERGVFYTAGNWDIPPAYHGNPWAPGGVGVAGPFVHEPLFIYIPTTKEFIPRLGLSFEESEDHKTLTVKLKEGVLWHDREKFSSKDVQTTFRIGELKKLVIWRNLESIDCPDDNTVVFNWKYVSPTNNIRALTEPITSPYHIFGKWADMVPEFRKEKNFLDEDNEEDIKNLTDREKKVREVLYKYHPELPIGTGPFMINEEVGKVTASDMMLIKFPDYYEAENVKIEKVRIMRWGSNEVVWSYLMAGEVDAVTPACPCDVAEEIMKRNPSTRIITPFDLSEYGLIYNCREGKTTADLKFRKAIAHILDRDMVRMVAYYYGDTVDDYSLGVPKSLRSEWLNEEFYKDLTVYDYSPEKAEKILTEAGYKKERNEWLTPKGKKIALEIVAPSGLTDLVLLAEASSSLLTKFGIPTQVRAIPIDLYATKIKEGHFDLAAENGAQITKYGHPSISYNRFYRDGALIKGASALPEELEYSGEIINTSELAEELNNSMDGERTSEIVRILAGISNEYLPFLTCYEKRILIFTVDGKRVTGWPAEDDPIWQAAPGGVESLYCTMIVKGMIEPAR